MNSHLFLGPLFFSSLQLYWHPRSRDIFLSLCTSISKKVLGSEEDTNFFFLKRFHWIFKKKIMLLTYLEEFSSDLNICGCKQYINKGLAPPGSIWHQLPLDSWGMGKHSAHPPSVQDLYTISIPVFGHSRKLLELTVCDSLKPVEMSA